MSNEWDKKQAGRLLDELMTKKGLRPADFARASGLPINVISRYRHQGMPETPGAKTLPMLAEGLDMDVAELRDYVGYPNEIIVTSPADITTSHEHELDGYLNRIEATISELQADFAKVQRQVAHLSTIVDAATRRDAEALVRELSMGDRETAGRLMRAIVDELERGAQPAASPAEEALA